MPRLTKADFEQLQIQNEALENELDNVVSTIFKAKSLNKLVSVTKANFPNEHSAYKAQVKAAKKVQKTTKRKKAA